MTSPVLDTTEYSKPSGRERMGTLRRSPMKSLDSVAVLSGSIGDSGPKPRPKAGLPWAIRDCSPRSGAMVRPAVPLPRAEMNPRREIGVIALS
jgi:hypothetical protein